MNRQQVSFAILLTMSSSLATEAAEADGPHGLMEIGQLLDCCRKPSGSLLDECKGHVAAIDDVLASENKINGFDACPPEGHRIAQAVAIVRTGLTEFVREHPDRQNSGADGLVASALADAYPCHSERGTAIGTTKPPG